jgi:chromosome segregation ATPase
MPSPSETDENQQIFLELESIRKKLDGLISRVQETEGEVKKIAFRNEEMEKAVDRSLDEVRIGLKSVREELDRSAQGSKQTTTNLEKRFSVLDQHLDLIKQEIDGIRARDLKQISEDIQKCPTMQGLVQELSQPTSHIASKETVEILTKEVFAVKQDLVKEVSGVKQDLVKEVSSVRQDIAKLSGMIDGYFKAGLIGILLTLATVFFNSFFVKVSSNSTPSSTPSSTPK